MVRFGRGCAGVARDHVSRGRPDGPGHHLGSRAKEEEVREFDDEKLYEVTGRKQKVWILGAILVAVLIGLVYILSQFG